MRKAGIGINKSERYILLHPNISRKSKIESTTELLQNLGFTIHPAISILAPT